MWNEATLHALDVWIEPEWRKARHPGDCPDFHQFVLAVWDETHTQWDERGTREFIRKRILNIHPELDEQFLQDFVDANVERGSAVLYFLSTIATSGRTL